MPPKRGKSPSCLHEIPAVSPSGDDSDTLSKHVNIVYYDNLTVGITFSSYIKSLVQAGSAQLARAKSYRVLARGHAQNMRRAAHMDTCTKRAQQPRLGSMSPK